MTTSIRGTGLLGLAAHLATRQKRQEQQRLEQQKQFLTDEIKRVEKLRGTYEKEDPQYQSLTQTLRTLYGGAPETAQSLIPGIPLGGQDFSAGIVQQGGRTRRLEELQRVQGQTVAARTRQTARDVGKPSQGLRDSYKKIGSQMVEQANKIAELRRAAPDPEGGLLGGNRKQVESFKALISREEQNLARFQETYDKIKAFADSSNETLEANEWDVFQASQFQPDLGPGTRGVFIREFTDEQGRPPTEAEIEIAKGKYWQ